MNTSLASRRLALPELLESARASALSAGLPYAGGITPAAAWALFSSDAALLVDVRSGEERKFVGHVPGSLHVPRATGTTLILRRMGVETTVRPSLAFYNTFSEIDRLTAVVRRLAVQRRAS